MKNTDIALKKRSYRGNTEYIVHWNADGLPDQCEFSTEREAAKFMATLAADSAEQATPAAEEWTIVTNTLLGQLQTTPEELNKFLAEISQKAKNGFSQWKDYADQAIQIRLKISKLAVEQSLSVDAYLAKLESFEGVAIDKVLEIYQEHTKAQQMTEELVGKYLDKLRLEESDDDEIEFVERKLARFLEAFECNVLYIEDGEIIQFIEAQKGSASAKKRLEEIVFDFKSFVASSLTRDEPISIEEHKTFKAG